MSGMVQIPLTIGTSESYSPRNDKAELVNLYPHLSSPGGKSNIILLSTPGCDFKTTFPGEIFGAYEFHGIVYVATLAAVYTYDTDLHTFSKIGDVNFRGKVRFADNGIELMMVSGNGCYYNPVTGIFGDMTTQEGWYDATTVDYIDSYFVFNRSGTGQFFISKSYSHEIDALDWATGEAAPDDTVAVRVSNRQLWLFGTRSTEVWYDSGDALFPFTRVSGAVTDVGCLNPDTVENIRDSIFFVADDFKVYATSGYQPVPVSNGAVEYSLSRADPTTISAFTYYQEGHWFYVLTIGTTATYVYDPGTQQWHSRKSTSMAHWNYRGVIERYHSAETLIYGGANVYELNFSSSQENGSDIIRYFVTPPLNKSVNRFRLHEVQLDMEVGGANELTITCESSKDGGYNWGNMVGSSSIQSSGSGLIGEYLTRVVWRRLGQFRDCTLRFTITGNQKATIIGLHARMT